MTSVMNARPSTTVAPSNDETAVPAARSLRRQVWPYAGLLAGASGLGWTMFLAQGQDTYLRDGHSVTTQYIYDAMSPAATMRIGGGIAVLALVSTVVFLIGLTRWIDERSEGNGNWRTALRWSSIAFTATASIGVVLHYVAASGARDGIDKVMYTHEASTTVAVLSDQLSFAASLPGLGVAFVVGVLAFRERILPRTVGVLVLLLALGSVGATVVVGLPYSSALVFPLFLGLTALAALLRRRPA